MISSNPEYEVCLRAVGESEPSVVVLDAGLATSMKTHLFAKAFPDRYFNLGIAEQNAVGVASGLARRGYIPLVHSFSNLRNRAALICVSGVTVVPTT
jgi:transketolase